MGSPANAAVRDRLVAELRELGLTPVLEEAFACSPHGICADVVNVFAALPGDGETVLLACHYDSVPAGPGASDDGAGVAALLEIAHLLKDEPRRHKVGFLFTDGEEAGLLGARAFAAGCGCGEVACSTTARPVKVVVNLEARGTTGAVAMFETGRDNAPLVDVVARHAPRPVTSSLLYLLYKQLPNDTDLTVFKRAGMNGLNLAFADGLPRYHTPQDDLAHLDLGSLQHMGDQALGTVRALASADVAGARGDAVFFDVLSLLVVRWPAPATPAVALAAALPLAIALARARRRGDPLVRPLLSGSAALVLSLAFAVPCGLALPFTLAAVRGPRPFAAHPEPALLAIAAASLAGAVVAGWLLAPRHGDALLGHASLLAILGLAAAFAVPEASFLPIVAAAATGAAAAVGTPAAVVLGALAAAVPLLELARVLAVMVGPEMGGALAVPWAVAGAGLAPLAAGVAGRRGLAVLAVLFTIAVAAAALVPAATAHAPRPLNVVFRQEGDAASWLLRTRGAEPPPAMLALRSFEPRDVQLHPWSKPAAVHVAEAASISLPPPTLDVREEHREGERRRVTATARSVRGAPSLAIGLPESSGATIARLAGSDVEPNSVRARDAHPGFLVYVVRGLRESASERNEDGIELELLLPPEPVEITVVDASRGLPDEGRDLQAARPENYAPIQDGDETIVIARARI